MSDNEEPRHKPLLPTHLVDPLQKFGRRITNRSVPSETGTVTPPSAIVDCALYINGERHDVTDIAAARQKAASRSNSFLWMGLHQPSPEELSEVATQFGLHPLAVEDAIHAHQRPKVEIYEENLFAVLKPARYVDPQEIVEIGEIMLFVGADYLISVRYGNATELKTARHELEERSDVLKLGVMAAFWAIADRVVDAYEEALDGLANDVDEIEGSVFDPKISTPTERIYRLKREILEFRRVVDPLDSALAPLFRGEVESVEEDVRPYFRDIHDHALRTAGRLASFDQQLNDILQANVAQVTLQQNEDMRRITAWAAILAVNTTVAGIYGMNFENMPELHWANGYYLCLGLMAVLSVALYVALHRRRWL